mmetsp:Transcript_1646/g.3783  ORF Transcript_1646/g.3783 Transcript_1646/m.3783 type:complete len:222 (-) Transcript_1646:826-1491(-)
MRARLELRSATRKPRLETSTSRHARMTVCLGFLRQKRATSITPKRPPKGSAAKIRPDAKPAAGRVVSPNCSCGKLSAPERCKRSMMTCAVVSTEVTLIFISTISSTSSTVTAAGGVHVAPGLASVLRRRVADGSRICGGKRLPTPRHRSEMVPELQHRMRTKTRATGNTIRKSTMKCTELNVTVPSVMTQCSAASGSSAAPVGPISATSPKFTGPVLSLCA